MGKVLRIWRDMCVGEGAGSAALSVAQVRRVHVIPTQVQEAFALTDSEAAAAPKGYATRLKGAGKVYNVYVHRCVARGRSKLGLRAAMLEVVEEAGRKGVAMTFKMLAGPIDLVILITHVGLK